MPTLPKKHPECIKDGQEDCETCDSGFRLETDSGRCVYKRRKLSLSDFKYDSSFMAVGRVPGGFEVERIEYDENKSNLGDIDQRDVKYRYHSPAPPAFLTQY